MSDLQSGRNPHVESFGRVTEEAIVLDDFFESHELRDEWANRMVDATGNWLAYPVAYAILSTDPNRFEDEGEAGEVALRTALTEMVRRILSEIRDDLRASLDYGLGNCEMHPDQPLTPEGHTAICATCVAEQARAQDALLNCPAGDR